MLDPLTALGLATNIVQFVDFGLKLFSTSIEIARSAKGATSLNLELEHAYTTLCNFASDLQFTDDGASDRPPVSGSAAVDTLGKAHAKAIRPHIAAIEGIAADCQDVCHQLLHVVRGLRVDPGSSKRRLKSVAAANTWLESQQSSGFKDIAGRLDVLLHKIQALSTHSTDKTAQPVSIQTIHESKPQPVRPADVEGLSDIVNDLSLAEDDITLAVWVQDLLKSLHFKARRHRHEAIPDAHKATFEWIFSDERNTGKLDAVSGNVSTGPVVFENSDNTAASDSFTTWLKSGRGIFWISGKPGSGKSTLMKFIADHPRTRELLQTQAAGKRLIVASHYFWNAGTEMQKSFKGLLQQLLLDILSHCPELARNVFPHRLSKSTAAPWSVNTNYTFMSADDEWTIRELRQGLLQIAQHPAMPIRCCFFIDGLDEYCGDENSGYHLELCEVIKSLAASDSIQCCVSSRPWNVFEDAFGRNSGPNPMLLQVHTLTYNDILLFTESRLQSIAQWEAMGINAGQVATLVKYIAENAQGVFLWAFLVSKSLQDGVIDGDTFDDIKRRLMAMPTELEPFFKHMLGRVDAVHHTYMAHALLAAVDAYESILGLMVCHVLGYELEDPNYALTWPPDFDIARFESRPELADACRRRVNARCGGLVHCFNSHVGFIHRTVYDFLKTRAMRDYLESKAMPGFVPTVAILKAISFLFRCAARTVAMSTNTADVAYMEVLFLQSLAYTGLAWNEDEKTTTRLVDAISNVQHDEPFGTYPTLQVAVDRIVNSRVVFKADVDDPSSSSGPKSSMAKEPMLPPPGLRHAFLDPHVTPYVVAKLRSNQSYFDAGGVSLLGTAVRHLGWIDARLVAIFLEAGCDPNERILSGATTTSPYDIVSCTATTTPWRFLLASVDANSVIGFSSRGVASVLALFLRHGASRAPIFRASGTVYSCVVYRFLDANLGVRNTSSRPEAPQSPNSRLELRAVFELVDVFLDTSADNNRVQMIDILHYIRTWDAFPPRAVSEADRVATVAFVEKMIRMAVELRLPAAVISPLMTSVVIWQHLSPSVLADIETYTRSHVKSDPDNPVTPCDSETAMLKHPSHDDDIEEANYSAKKAMLGQSFQMYNSDLL
ncbi:hypothetical protein SPBR_04584 [Sporothrix brasiliensis 5110]|uniref:NACHT domain-containing protein n=1 Tax=Sporothrix brasiliensis 5110 TaxID=1398154 RepID=A0A0C2IJY0_9PEZI|nr:uncharacterized protein SPBR_04584 [Sporothrix brasiliensis 5110]KIH87280.1 hypothetical protein SPBR_04584 [Sporothrix brasiliensis 5110]